MIVAYADGACSGNPGPAGLGVTIQKPDGTAALSEYLGHATNNIAELTAILRVLEYFGTSDQAIQIRTDSQYCIGVLSLGWKAKANQALIADIKTKLRGFKSLKFVHVRGHSGEPGNEIVDELARRAVSERKSTGWMPPKV